MLQYLQMRRPRIKAQGLGFYHCISRSVEGRVIFPNGNAASEEGEKFAQLKGTLWL
jgi:hypothetical protein